MAVIDVERLRRGCGSIGYDVLRASESWLARDALCTRLRQLRNLHGVDEVRVRLQPPQSDEDQAFVLLRVVVTRNLMDEQDWHVIGSPVVLRVLIFQRFPHATMDIFNCSVDRMLSQQKTSVDASRLTDEGTIADRPEMWGMTVRQLVLFRDRHRSDLEQYCNVHKFYSKGRQHVCMMNPCPFDGKHKGVPHIAEHSLPANRSEADVVPLDPNMHVVTGRYIKPETKDMGMGWAVLMNEDKPLKARKIQYDPPPKCRPPRRK